MKKWLYLVLILKCSAGAISEPSAMIGIESVVLL